MYMAHPRHGVERSYQHIEEGQGGEYFGRSQRGGSVHETIGHKGEERDHDWSCRPEENAHGIQILDTYIRGAGMVNDADSTCIPTISGY